MRRKLARDLWETTRAANWDTRGKRKRPTKPGSGGSAEPILPGSERSDGVGYFLTAGRGAGGLLAGGICFEPHFELTPEMPQGAFEVSEPLTVAGTRATSVAAVRRAPNIFFMIEPLFKKLLALLRATA